MEKKQLNTIVVPALETTKEGKLRGGFSMIGNTGISVCGGPNKECGSNDVCTDNTHCYNNSDSQLCSGNHASTDCSSHRSTNTSTSTSTSTSASRAMMDIFSLF